MRQKIKIPESGNQIRSLIPRKFIYRVPLSGHKILWIDSRSEGKSIRFFGETHYYFEQQDLYEVFANNCFDSPKSICDLYILFRLSDDCKVFDIDFNHGDFIHSGTRSGYTFSFLDSSDVQLGQVHKEVIPHPNYFKFLKDKYPETKSIVTYVNIDVLVFSLNRNEHIRPPHFYDEALFRAIEVWGEKISKDTVKKLCATTGRKPQSVSSVLGNGVKDGWAFKNAGEWSFDIPQMLARKRLNPLPESAKTAIKRRAYDLKSR